MDISQLKAIPLTKGFVAYVDPEDYELVSQYKWCAAVRKNGRVYAYRKKVVDGSRKSELLHRLIMAADGARTVDHRDHDGLNNSRSNLRICTYQQNNRNRRKHTATSSHFKGVLWDNRREKWYVRLKVSGRTTELGYYDTEQAAAYAYDTAASVLFGDYACLNFGQPDPEPADDFTNANAVLAAKLVAGATVELDRVYSGR